MGGWRKEKKTCKNVDGRQENVYIGGWNVISSIVFLFFGATEFGRRRIMMFSDWGKHQMGFGISSR